MSFSAAAWAIKSRPRTAREKLILIVLADCYNDDTKRCDPSLTFIAKRALCARNTVITALNSLEEQGFISRTRGDFKTSTKYVLNISKQVEDCARSRIELGRGLNQGRSRIEPGVGRGLNQGRSRIEPEPIREPISKPIREPIKDIGHECPISDVELWDEFLKNRKSKKAQNTPRALATLVNKIRDLEAQGYDPVKLVELANESGWKTVFPRDDCKRQTNDEMRGVI